MRLFYNFCIIVFVLLSLYIVKDDIMSVYAHTATYVHEHFVAQKTPAQITTDPTTASQAPTTPSEDTTTTKAASSSVTPKNKAGTPGPLKVLDSYLVGGSKDTVLTSKGVIALTNDQRHTNGNLPALTENTKLDSSAAIKLADMFTQQYFEHVSPNGTGVSDLGTEVGYQYVVIGENLALGNFKGDKALVDAWMASPGHRANILNTHYSQIGVAVGHGMFNGKDTWLAVQHFGLPQDACPAIDDTLHNEVVFDQKNIIDMEADLKLRSSKIESGAVYEGHTTDEQITIYNEFVVKYNQLIAKVKKNIEIYNDQVRAFNACVSDNTGAVTHAS